MYAQTILELLNRLRRDGYAVSDLCLIRDAHALAMRAFTGLVRSSGKTFLAHAVGTAGVLHHVGAPPPVTAAGVIHSIHAHGDFGRWRKGISRAARSEVERSVGTEVEQLVARYAALKWNRSTMPAIGAALNVYDAVGRAVVLMRLANEVEENLDAGVLYLSHAERRRQADQPSVPILVTMAEDLGNPILASELARVFEETISATIPTGFHQEPKDGVFLRAPTSYRKTLRVYLAQLTMRGHA